jgi:hypothetical protein
MNTRTASTTRSEQHGYGNAAVNGLVAGAAAGIAMLGYLLLTAGDAPGDLLTRFTGAGIEASPLMGAVTHLAVSAIYGMGFGLIWRAVHSRYGKIAQVLFGLAYGLALYAISQWLMLPAAQSPLLELPMPHWGIAHAIYGIVLGYSYRLLR